jgi:hypothetical protein
MPRHALTWMVDTTGAVAKPSGVMSNEYASDEELGNMSWDTFECPKLQHLTINNGRTKERPNFLLMCSVKHALA